MKDSKQVLLTFDYEMFLGKSGTIDNCLLRPTKELITVLANGNAKATFFIDTTFMLVLRQNNQFNEYNKIKAQLIQLVSHGHRIELHIHPHWIDATYNHLIQQWDFNDFRYYQHKNTPSALLRNLFINGVELLNEIAKEVDSEYRPQAYRAGGWCIEPFANLINLFRETGIWVDSSVLPSISTVGNIADYDYSNIKCISPYYFNKSVQEVLDHGDFLEIPLSVVDIDLLFRISRKIKIKCNPQEYACFGDGKAIFTAQMQGEQRGIKVFIGEKLNTTPEVLSLDGAADFRKICSVVSKSQTSTIVGHPKLLTINSLGCLTKILKCDDKNFWEISKFANFIKINK